MRIGIVTRQERDAEARGKAGFFLLVCLYASSCLQKTAGKLLLLQLTRRFARRCKARTLPLQRCSCAGRETFHAPSATSRGNPIAQTCHKTPARARYVQDGARKAAIVSAGAASHDLPSRPTAESAAAPPSPGRDPARGRRRSGVGRERGVRRAEDEESS